MTGHTSRLATPAMRKDQGFRSHPLERGQRGQLSQTFDPDDAYLDLFPILRWLTISFEGNKLIEPSLSIYRLKVMRNHSRAERGEELDTNTVNIAVLPVVRLAGRLARLGGESS